LKFSTVLIILIIVTSCQRHEGGYIADYDWGRGEYMLSDFMPLNVGNYWIYNVYETDTMGNDSLIGADTLVITSDTLMHGRHWFLLYESHGFGSETPFYKFISDSAGYLVYDDGQIGFSTVNFTDTLRRIENEGISYAAFRMEKDPEEVKVPAGIFRCLNYKASVVINKSLSFWKHPDNYCNYYAPGIGKVKSTAFYISKPKRLERRLVKYHLE